jgi:hypothetical protein
MTPMFDTASLYRQGIPFDSRRVRRWDLSPQELMTYLNQLCNPDGIDRYYFFKSPKLPDGFTVLSTFQHSDPWRLSFYSQHPSYAPAQPGQSESVLGTRASVGSRTASGPYP